MAIIRLNPKFPVDKKQSWGFLLIDSNRNKFPFKFSHNKLELKDDIAKDFIDDPRLIIEFENGLLHKPDMSNINIPKDIKTKVITDEKHIYTKNELFKLDFDDLREIGYKVGAKGRSKKGLIQDIIDIQSGKKKPEIEL